MATATKEQTPATAAGANNGLAVLPSSGFLALSSASKDLQAAQDSIAAIGEVFRPSDLTRVKTPSGGGVRWEISDGLGGTESAESITGILVYAQRCGVLWPSFDPVPGGSPVLRTYDLEIAEQVGPIPDTMVDQLEKVRLDERHFYWGEQPKEINGKKYPGNPFNQWGTGKEGQGKRCREQRVLFVLRQGDIYPLVVTVQPGSLDNIRKFLLNIPKLRVPFWRCVVSLKLEKATNRGGKTFSRIVPSLNGMVDEATGNMVKAKFYDVLDTGVARQVADQEAAGEEE